MLFFCLEWYLYGMIKGRMVVFVETTTQVSEETKTSSCCLPCLFQGNHALLRLLAASLLLPFTSLDYNKQSAFILASSLSSTSGTSLIKHPFCFSQLAHHQPIAQGNISDPFAMPPTIGDTTAAIIWYAFRCHVLSSATLTSAIGAYQSSRWTFFATSTHCVRPSAPPPPL